MRSKYFAFLVYQTQTYGRLKKRKKCQVGFFFLKDQDIFVFEQKKTFVSGLYIYYLACFVAADHEWSPNHRMIRFGRNLQI